MTDRDVPPRDDEQPAQMYRVVIVCLGNICRSPTAAAVLRDRLDRAGLSDRIAVDSAGTGAWHVGEPADPRAADALRRHGYDDTHRARQFQRHDFADFDLVLAADASNASDLRDLARTPAEVAKVRLLRSFDPASPPDAEVPDPYYGAGGFDEVLAIIEAVCDGLVAQFAAGGIGGHPDVGQDHRDTAPEC